MPVKFKPANFPIVLLYNVDPEWTSSEKEEVIIQANKLSDALAGMGHPVTLLALTEDDLDCRLKSFERGQNIVFNWCEALPGRKNSEWLVARQLEIMGFTFTGADAETLVHAQDKLRVKHALEQAGISTPAWRVFSAPDSSDWKHFPAIVKPVNEHCSTGINANSVVMDSFQLQERISLVIAQYEQPALVEDFIDGREFHVSVLGNEDLMVLPVAEMDFSFFKNVQDRLCSYDAKFIPGSLHYEKIETLLPAPLSEEESRDLSDVCRRAYRAIGCRDYARLDIRLQEGIFYVLDVNPNADISYDASMACAAEQAGISYGQMGSLIVQMAAERHPQLRKMFKPARRRKRENAEKRIKK